jgi:hypothetical protein
LAAPPPALADGAQVHVEAASIAANSSVSGFSSHQNFTARQAGNGAFLYGIRGGETRDHPCHLELVQPHCGLTYGYQECPNWSVSDNRSGMIAVGLLMHHDGAALTGIQLICRDVVSGPYTTLKAGQYWILTVRRGGSIRRLRA